MRIILTVILCGLMAGCQAPAPEPFETGEEVSAPVGCVIAKVRKRNVDC